LKKKKTTAATTTSAPMATPTHGQRFDGSPISDGGPDGGAALPTAGVQTSVFKC
jgi:hypothetical protein